MPPPDAPLPPPPDGARLDDLERRRDVMTRLELRRALPREGLALAPRAGGWPVGGISLERVVVVDGWEDGDVRERPPAAAEQEALRGAWGALWTDDEPGEPEAAWVVLHWRGLLRCVSPSRLPPVLRRALSEPRGSEP